MGYDVYLSYNVCVTIISGDVSNYIASLHANLSEHCWQRWQCCPSVLALLALLS